MTELNSRIKHAMGEARILVLACEVLIGLQFRTIFEKGFTDLPPASQNLKIAGIGLMLMAAALAMAPAAFHRIAERGEDTERLHELTSQLMCVALLPLIAALSFEVHIAYAIPLGFGAGLAAACIMAALAVFFLYGFELWQRSIHRESQGENKEMPETKETPLKDKVEHVLSEAKMVLPGAQAMLGFQFITVMTEAFKQLPASLQDLHLACIGAVAMAIVLLMAPAAYHRIVEEGNDTVRFHKIAGRFISWAMAFLALGLCGDFYVVLLKVTEAPEMAGGVAALTLAIYLTLWYLYPLRARFRSARLPLGRMSRRASAR